MIFTECDIVRVVQRILDTPYKATLIIWRSSTNCRELVSKRVHDFKIPELGKVAPYGVFDIAANHGWVSVGIDADTGAFAVESIRRWWYNLGRPRYPSATRLTITADCGGSNGPKVKLWKRELQRLANESDLKIMLTHLPTGTSTWNKIEHRLFALHHDELARQAAGEPSSDRATDRRDQDRKQG